MRLLLKRTRTFRSIKPITNKIIESREANALDFCIDNEGVSQRSLCESHSKVIIQENAFLNKIFILPEFFLCVGRIT